MLVERNYLLQTIMITNRKISGLANLKNSLEILHTDSNISIYSTHLNLLLSYAEGARRTGL